MVHISLKVETASTPGKMANPVSFTLRDRIFQIIDVVDSWHGSDHAYFKVFADDGNLYVIKHDLNADLWELLQMEAITGS